MLAPPDPMNLDLIWVGSHLQRVPLVSRLSTAFLAAGFPQAAIARLLETITGRRFATVAAVLGQLVFQSLYPCFQLLENAYPVAHKTENQLNDRIFALASGCTNFFFGREARWLHTHILTDLHDFDNGKVQSFRAS